MYVVATAGHVDHGKSTLVKRLTGLEPDRWDEEKDRGLTIDLGFVWTRTPADRDVAFVDVPGHEKFLGNMLAGVGPAPVVMFVVAADEGWQAQSNDHRDAVDAFGIRHGFIVLTRADRASAQRRAEVEAQVRRELAGTTLADAPAVTVSAHTGEGIDALLTTLDSVLEAAHSPDAEARVRMWLDRSFTIKGAGTVVTGTLAAGTVSVGDTLALSTVVGLREVQVRSIQSEESARESIGPVNRVALNLRGVAADEVGRGDALLTPEAWPVARAVDARRTSGADFAQAPQEVALHIGSAQVQAQVRPLGQEHVRLTLDRPLPLAVGDRMVLRKPGDRHVYAGVAVLDVDPPALTRRGAATRRAAALAALPLHGDPVHEVTRRGAIRRADLVRFGLDVPETPPTGIVAFRGWWIHAPQVISWRNTLTETLDRHLADNPLSPGLSRGAALSALTLPAEELLALPVAAAKLEQAEGLIRQPGAKVDLGEAEPGVATLERRLRDAPFAAPEADDLTALKLGAKQLAAAERAGRLLRLAEGIVLLPDAPRKARTILAALPQPFTTSEARKALETSRRVAIPLLEHMDAKALTRRVDGANRRVI
ncbi:selenocysteine-specific translation elongation factor [Corynebacterium guangdongense]|uniref:Selenocysteine-specific elongation factor n=1 Tax=Corynebacterium guangdongense TaxID=1783348 RepID=A0ABU1ZXP6_9CORY|nr:selenocysteine-specific translation elongation factor [Corynebacterium guangdongense]MDR7328992.1 selenocysteine-specific elongation factor [Corynebacterium guangdongense]WJZ17563.1 Selenocysteine-specific elongation factor [Corynebacterium guangdongense]